LSEAVFIEVVVWQVSQPVRGSSHSLIYSLALVADGACVLRYDNEAGKGDHKHMGGQEVPFAFTSVQRLLEDFRADVEAWRKER
jgi:hypothetical protein